MATSPPIIALNQNLKAPRIEEGRSSALCWSAPEIKRGVITRKVKVYLSIASSLEPCLHFHRFSLSFPRAGEVNNYDTSQERGDENVDEIRDSF